MAHCALVRLLIVDLYATVASIAINPPRNGTMCVPRIPTENVMKIITAVLVSTLIGGAAVAQTSDPSTRSRTPAAAATSSSMASADAKRDDAVEKHIDQLHDSLKITPVQEAQWNEVAATMRDNAKAMDRAIDKRAANAANATAIDDLKAYEDIAQTHANGVAKLATAFSGLYSSMSDDQKKAADAAFSHRGHEVKKVASR
jgi:protein CpxP